MTNADKQALLHEKYMAEAYSPVVKAAGLFIGDESPMDLFLISGTIEADPEVQERAKKFRTFPSPQLPAIFYTDYVAAVNTMNPAELSALRARVRQRHPKY